MPYYVSYNSARNSGSLKAMWGPLSVLVSYYAPILAFPPATF